MRIQINKQTNTKHYLQIRYLSLRYIRYIQPTIHTSNNQPTIHPSREQRLKVISITLSSRKPTTVFYKFFFSFILHLVEAGTRYKSDVKCENKQNKRNLKQK